MCDLVPVAGLNDHVLLLFSPHSICPSICMSLKEDKEEILSQGELSHQACMFPTGHKVTQTTVIGHNYI